jgi:hypothetical protein
MEWMQEDDRGAGDASMLGIKIGGQMAKLNGRSTMAEGTGILLTYEEEPGELESNVNWGAMVFGHGWTSGIGHACCVSTDLMPRRRHYQIDNLLFRDSDILPTQGYNAQPSRS